MTGVERAVNGAEWLPRGGDFAAFASFSESRR